MIKPLLLTESWMAKTWEFGSKFGITFPDRTPTIPLYRQNDECIMDKFLTCSDIPKKHLTILNRCRIYLQVFTVADIGTGDGVYISHNAWHGIRTSRRATLTWPEWQRPPSKDWVIWRQSLTKALCCNSHKRLQQTLGPWTKQIDHQWWINSSDKSLWQKKEHQWIKWVPVMAKSRRPRYRRVMTTEPPSTTLLLPTTTFQQGDYIMSEGFHSQHHSNMLNEKLIDTTRPQWLFNTYTLDGNESAIVQAILDGTATMVSDGSYKEDKGIGAAASILCTEDTSASIEISSLSPGETHMQSSYRSEILGILGGLQVLTNLCNKHDIKEGHCNIVCDGKGALMKVFSTYGIKTTTSNADLLSACKSLIEKLPIRLTPHHVKAHQDTVKTFVELSNWEKLNVLMDFKAKQALKRHEHTPLVDIAQYTPHPLSIPTPSFSNIPIRYNFTKALYNKIYDQRLSRRWIKQQRTTPITTEDVVWTHQGSALRSLKFHERKFVSKWASNYLPTGEQLVHWKQRVHGHCPFCQTPMEDKTHILHCRHPAAEEGWDKSFTTYKGSLRRIQTSPAICKIIQTELHHWHHNTIPPEIQVLTPRLQRITVAQRQIGWQGFLEGLVTSQWLDYQQQYLEHKGSRMKATTWIQHLLRYNWKLLRDIWKHRNEQLHQTQMILDNEGHKELLTAVEKEWKIGLGRLPIRDFAHLFQIKKDKFYSRTVEYIKNWFVTVRLGRELHDNNHLIIDEFSIPGPLQTWVGLQNSRIETRDWIRLSTEKSKLAPAKLPKVIFLSSSILQLKIY